LAMTGNGRLANSLLQIPDEQRYSFVFGGISQLIDGILLSPALADGLLDVDILHVNADFPDVLGEDLTANGLPFRSTDHDIPIILLRLDEKEQEEEVAVEETAVLPQPTPTKPVEVVENEEGGKRPFAWWLIAVPALIGAVGLAVWRYKTGSKNNGSVG